MKKKISFKIKLTLYILMVSIIPLIISSIITLNYSISSLEDSVFQKLESVRDAKNQNISRYLKNLTDNIITLAHNKMIIDGVPVLKASFFSEAKELLPSEFKKLESYYRDEFSKEYKTKNNRETNAVEILKTLSVETKFFQYLFIAENTNPLGSKHLLDGNSNAGSYNQTHRIIHPILREYLEKYALYDIFIFDLEGNILYTVFKELDFATNIKNGPYKDSNLAKVFNLAMASNDKNQFSLVEFERYYPSYEAPASFLATPIWENNKKIGILAFQLPLSTINEIMAENSGLGKSGEAYLVGDDFKLRSDIIQNKEFNLFNSFNYNKLVKTATVEKALSGTPGKVENENYDNKKVFSSYGKLNFKNFNWVIVVDQLKSEALEKVANLKYLFIVIILMSIAIVILVSFFISKNLSNQIEGVVEKLSTSVHEVQNSNQKLDIVSGNLIESVQTQISSITESAAAMDEISSMIKNNIDSSKRISVLSDEAKQNVNTGKEKMSHMIEEVNLISNSYDQIEDSMNVNNSNLEKILSVIIEIVDKTKIINEIVFQTKLLSFNASVEAARAGEAGKGFSVVAEEVGNLAKMSGQAAEEIAQMLINSQKEVQEITISTKSSISKILETGRKQVIEGEKIASECSSELVEILTKVDLLDTSIKEITLALNEQSIGAEEVNAAMKQLENSANETTQASNKTQEAASNLRDQAHLLRESTQELRKIIGSKKAYDVRA